MELFRRFSSRNDLDLSPRTWIGNELRAYGKYQVVVSSRVREALLEMGLEKLDDAGRRDLAATLDVDSFLVPVIVQATNESSGATGFWSGSSFWVTDSPVQVGSVQLALVRASDGRPILKGSGYGQSEWRTRKGVVSRVFHDILAAGLSTSSR